MYHELYQPNVRLHEFKVDERNEGNFIYNDMTNSGDPVLCDVSICSKKVTTKIPELDFRQ